MELGGGGKSGTPPPEPLDVAAPEERLDISPRRLVVGRVVLFVALEARPGMEMEKV